MRATFAAVVALSVVGGPAYGHGEYDWIRQHGYIDAMGSLCCGENDCLHLPMTARPITDGWLVRFVFRGKEYEETVVDRAVYKSENHEEWLCIMFNDGRPIIRCVFLPVAG